MSTDFIHRIGIAAAAGTIYRALSTEGGIRAWWATDVKLDSYAGGRSDFGFFGRTTEFQMRIEKLTPPALVRWQSTGGTTPEFTLEPHDGEVLLKFCHGGWERGGDHCHFCNTTWGQLLVCLKDLPSAGCRILFSLDLRISISVSSEIFVAENPNGGSILCKWPIRSAGFCPANVPPVLVSGVLCACQRFFLSHNITRSVCGGTGVESLDQFELLEAIQRGQWGTTGGTKPLRAMPNTASGF